MTMIAPAARLQVALVDAKSFPMRTIGHMLPGWGVVALTEIAAATLSGPRRYAQMTPPQRRDAARRFHKAMDGNIDVAHVAPHLSQKDLGDLLALASEALA